MELRTGITRAIHWAIYRSLKKDHPLEEVGNIVICMDPSNVRGAKKIEYEVVACGPMTVEIKDDDGDVFDTEELDGEYVTLEPRYNTWDTFRTLNIRKEKFLDNFKKKCT